MAQEEQKILVELAGYGYRSMEDMRNKLKLESNEDVLNMALSILSWAVEKSTDGHEVGTIDPNDKLFCKINIKQLDALRERTKNKQKTEAEAETESE